MFLHVLDCSTARHSGHSILNSRAVGECNSTKVRKWNLLAVASIALIGILDNPFRIDLTDGRGFVKELVGDNNAWTQISCCTFSKYSVFVYVPVVRFSIVAWPDVVLVAVTLILIESPAEIKVSVK